MQSAIAAASLPRSDITLRRWGETYLELKRAQGLRSAHTIACIWRCHIAEAEFIDARLEEIRRVHLRAFVRALATKPARHARITTSGRRTDPTGQLLARKTVRGVLQVLHNAFAAAVDEELIDHNPASGLRVQAGARIEHGWTYLTADEILLIRNTTELPEENRTIFLTAIYTGLRKGELWGLRWIDVVLDSAQPHLVVRRSFDGPTKNGRVGYVPLLPAAYAILSRWREATCGTELVFPWRCGTRLGEMRGKHDTARWCHHWSRNEKRAGWRARLGIERRVRFHDLRHTAASHLLMGTWGRRWALAEVRDFLRHSSIRETERYAHLAPGAIFDAARATTGA